MARFYHIDKAQRLGLGETIELAHPEDVNPVIEELYPDGLSRYGREYARDPVVSGMSFTNGDDEEMKLERVKMDGLHESFFELVRRDMFPGKPSRLQSIFCCGGSDTLAHFLDEYTEYPVTIWELEGEGYHKGDMTHIKTGNFARGVQNARRYWTGDGTEDPIWEIAVSLPVEVVDKVAEVDGPEDIPDL